MKRLLTILSLVILGFASTSCYDDSALWGSLEGLEGRIKTLETLCTEMNTNIASLQGLVSAMKQGDYIVDVTPLKENGVEVGYTITFNDRGAVNIYHGKDGMDSDDVPVFGVKEDSDGEYYWTVNGVWVLDDKGNRIPVSPSSGADGTTPKLKVENGRWYVSYDGGKSWEDLGSAAVEGAVGCVFKNVELKDGNLILTMSDGSVLTLPVGLRFRIVLGDFDASAIQYGTEVEVPYTIEGASGEVSVFAVSDGWMFRIKLIEDSPLGGKLIISQDDYYDEEISGKVAIFATTEDGTTVSKVIRLSSGVLCPSENYYDHYTVSAEAGKLEVTVLTNRTIEVKTNADWITCADTKAVEEKVIVFDIKENEGARRETEIEIASGGIEYSFTVVQKGFSGAFAVNVSCNEAAGGSWRLGVDTLFNGSGQTLPEVLGYSSWNEVAQAAGSSWDEVYNRTGEVKLLAYDLSTGEALPYDEQNCNGLGFCHTADGGLSVNGAAGIAHWSWLFSYGDDEMLDDSFSFSTMIGICAGETYSFGILITSPHGEARIEVSIDVTEYIDPEKGLYDNPAAPGRYEFTISDTLKVDELTWETYMSAFIINEDIAEHLKSTLGMTTYEIYQERDNIEKMIYLENGEKWSGDSQLPLDSKGHYSSNAYETTVARVSYNFSYGNLYSDTIIPTTFASGGPQFTPAVYDAIGKTVTYDYVIRYNGYEIVFIHELFFEGEKNDQVLS